MNIKWDVKSVILRRQLIGCWPRQRVLSLIRGWCISVYSWFGSVELPCWASNLSIFKLGGSLALLGWLKHIDFSSVPRVGHLSENETKRYRSKSLLITGTSCSQFPSRSWGAGLIAVCSCDVMVLGKNGQKDCNGGRGTLKRDLASLKQWKYFSRLMIPWMERNE